MIIGIVAIAENYAIGKHGTLPWHYSADLRFFKRTTTGGAIVMGSVTWRSIGRPLPDRLNVVMSRSVNAELPPGVLLLQEKADARELAKYLSGDLFIIGGSKTFAEFADMIEKWIVTKIPLRIEDADTFMPADFLEGFELENTIDLGDGLCVEIMRRNGF